MRIDGELIFPAEFGVAWREFDQMCRGATHRVLVKDLDGVRLLDRRTLEHEADKRCLNARTVAG